MLVSLPTRLTPGAGDATERAAAEERSGYRWKRTGYNGVDLASQKAIAKSLIKLDLIPGMPLALAAKTRCGCSAADDRCAEDGRRGSSAAARRAMCTARFDLIVTALLDEAYQDRRSEYTNWTRMLAAMFAVLLAFLGGWTLEGWRILAIICVERSVALAFLIRAAGDSACAHRQEICRARLAAAVNTMQAGEEVGADDAISRSSDSAGRRRACQAGCSLPGHEFRRTTLAATMGDLLTAINGRHVLIATHGFNVNRENGIASLSNWGSLLQLGPASAFVGLLWPGDSVWAHGLDYPGEARVADDAGALAGRVSLTRTFKARPAFRLPRTAWARGWCWRRSQT